MEPRKESMEDVFFPEMGVVRCETFSQVYPMINNYILDHQNWELSRDGLVKEMLDIKTTVLNPYRRCVGGYGRDINVFFLLAEAMWIYAGRKDVKFLTLFNKRMATFSDYGEVFHAPYGFRLRHQGVRAEDKFSEDNIHAAQGMDQVAYAIKALANNPNSRQVVMSIWNPDLDLGIASKDIPCNDMVMLKIRDGKLITTIQNRSNDLHWGLPTNLFQFSFLTEMMSLALGIRLGTQTHNSQSLHVYEWNEVAKSMFDNFVKKEKRVNLYDVAVEHSIDFDFVSEVPANRLREMDIIVNLILELLERVAEGKPIDENDETQIEASSRYLYNVYCLLKVYLDYKSKIKLGQCDEERDAIRLDCLTRIETMANASQDGYFGNQDIFVLAMNFFASRVKEYNHAYLGKL